MQVTHGRAHVLAWRAPQIARFVFFFNARVTSWLPARVRGPAGGSNSLPEGSVHVGRSTRQLRDVTGRVQHARLIIAAQVRELRVAALECAFKFKKTINSEQNKSKPRFRVNMDSRGRGEISPVLGHRIYN